MDRRDALKALTGIAATTGMSVTPVTVKDAEHVALIIIRAKMPISRHVAERLQDHWTEALKGTPLEDTKTVVLGDDLDVEFVRK